MINLLNHSYFSLLMSSMSVDDIINHALKNKQTAVCLTDFNNMYGAMEFYNKAIAHKLKPIIGLHIKYNDSDLFLIAKNNDGYKNLMKISSLTMIKSVSETDLTLLQSNIKSTNTLCDLANKFDLNDYIDNLYVIGNDASKIVLKTDKTNIFSLDQTKINPIAAKPSFYLDKKDSLIVASLNAIATGNLLEDIDQTKFKDFAVLTNDDIIKNYSKLAIKNLEHIINTCYWSLDLNKNHYFLDYAKLNGYKSSAALLKTLCKQGINKYLGYTDTIPKKYADRLLYELDVIDKMGFNNYFLVVQDYVNYAKNNGIIVGPGRGSAAGSLVSYLLGITQVDPIKNNLIFERFLNPDRSTMPDIDVDFMDNRRNEVVQYLYDKYGENHVAHIIIFQRIKAKMAIRDVGRILGIANKIIDNISKLITDEGFDEVKASSALKKEMQNFPQLFAIASKIINFPRQYGLHAAGVVLSNLKLTDVIPIQLSSDGIMCTQFSMEYLEPLGLIKMDILGLINLTTIDEIIKLIYKNHSKLIKLNDIKLNDPKVFDYIAKGNTAGIFQLESFGMTGLVTKLQPRSIEDISICSALYRPGPQKNINTYLKNRNNPSEIKYLNDDLKPILESTSGIIIYQEQVIQMVQKVAGFSLAQADIFRRAISKKKAETMAKLKQEFVLGAIKNKYDENTAKKIFDTLFEFANYGFNHSHSIAYSYVSYWLAYFAYYYPLEFYSVILANSSLGLHDLNFYIKQALKAKVKILLPDINKSMIDFSIYKNAIIFGFNIVKGCGVVASKKIIELRNSLPNKQFQNTFDTIKKIAHTKTVSFNLLKDMFAAGIFDELIQKENKTRFWFLNNLKTIYDNCDNFNAKGECITKIKFIDKQPTKEDLRQLNELQEKLLGINLSIDSSNKKDINNKQIDVDQIIEDIKNNVHFDKSLNDVINAKSAKDKSEIYRSIVKITSIRKITTKTNKPMAFINFKDNTSFANGTIFPGEYMKVADFLVANEYYIITYSPNFYNGNLSFEIKGMRHIDKDKYIIDKTDEN